MPEVFVRRDGDERQLTRLGEPFLARIDPRPYEPFVVPARDGAEIDAWVVLPPGFDPAGSYPALLVIHGGPFTQYGNRFFDEVQLYASAGYVVVFSNPRGSSGRETAWGRAITGPKHRVDPGTGWGSVDYDDLMAVMDEAQRRYPAIDPDRLGVLGGSYGGYMTSWIVSHTDRFAAACSERAVNNLLTLEGTSDIAGAFRTQMGVSHLEDPTEYLARSPITYAHRIRTPLLIIHSEEDWRCPIEQAEQLFAALRLRGHDVELVRFPGENHELSRSGSPVHRVQRAEIILEFFAKHLEPEAAERPPVEGAAS
jgi:dipeptidyl aminopeptidase/acylaminoacyl peptidase